MPAASSSFLPASSKTLACLAGPNARQVYLGRVRPDHAAVFVVARIGLARLPLHPGQRVTHLVGEDLVAPLRHAFRPRQDDGGAAGPRDGAGGAARLAAPV